MFDKLLCVILLAVCAIQISDGGHLNGTNAHTIDSLLQNIKDTIRKVQDVVKVVGEDVHLIIKELQQNVLSVLYDDNYLAIFIQNIEEKVNETIKDSGKNDLQIKKCIDTEKKTVDDVTKSTISAAKICISNADNLIRTLKDKIMNVEDNASSQLDNILGRFTSCVVDNSRDATKALLCIESLITSAKIEMKKIVQELEDMNASAAKTLNEATKDFKNCISTAKIDAFVKQPLIIEDFKTCINNCNHTQNKNEDVLEIINGYISDLQTSYDNIIKTNAEIIGELQTEIKKILSNINISGIVAKIQERVENILQTAGVDPNDAKECLESEKSAVDELADDIKNGITKCVTKADDVSRIVKDLALDMEDKLEVLLKDIKNKFTNCMNGSETEEGVKCLERQLETITKQFNDMQKEVNDFIDNSRNLISTAKFDFTSCMTGAQNSFISKQDTILNDLQKCISALKPKIIN